LVPLPIKESKAVNVLLAAVAWSTKALTTKLLPVISCAAVVSEQIDTLDNLLI